MSDYTFKQMEGWSLEQLRKVRKKLRDELADEIHKREAIKAEVIYLQKEIYRYQNEH